MTPNLFELNFITGMPTETIGEALEAAQALREMGPEIVLVTSVTDPSDSGDNIRMLAVDHTGAWQVETPFIKRDIFGSGYVGSGDLTAAMFLAYLLKGDNVDDALAGTASVVYSVLRTTEDLGMLELALVQAQDSIVSPLHRFTAVPLA
jgi:pyridoxine kinase